MKQRKIIRRESDYYPTPDAVAERIVRMCTGHGFPASILEPSAGSGAFVRACKKYLPNSSITAVEPHRDDDLAAAGAACWSRLTLEEFAAHRFLTGERPRPLPGSTLEEFADHRRFDLIIGNPPYSLAEEHVRICLGLLADGGQLVFLLRLAFLESAKRVQFWRDFQPERVDVFAKRPSFTHDGKTDSAAYAVFRWRRGHRGGTELGWLK